MAYAAGRLAALVPEVTTADALWFQANELPLYQCMGPAVLSFLGSLWRDAESAASHRRSPVHFWSERYKSKMREINVDLLYIADACECSVPIAPSRLKHANASLELFAMKSFQKGELI